jgi:hypothetical membrane protein
VGGAQFIIALIIAEAIYPEYNVSANVISDLGVWSQPSAAVFNTSIILLGLLIMAGAFFVQKTYHKTAISIFMGLSGLGSLGVGLFPENTLIIVHTVFALIAFVFSGIAAISTYKLTKSPFSYLTIILGAGTLLAAILFVVTSSVGYLGLGVGGMERMITYPTLIWVIGFGGYMLGDNSA